MRNKSLCNVSDIENDGSAAFTIEMNGKAKMVLVVRKENKIFVYLNSCPHTGGPLDIRPGNFLSKDKKHLLCSTHGALFNIEDGYCVFGPCQSSSLESIPVQIKDGQIIIL